jgi:hypothetical protein
MHNLNAMPYFDADDGLGDKLEGFTDGFNAILGGECSEVQPSLNEFRQRS